MQQPLSENADENMEWSDNSEKLGNYTVWSAPSTDSELNDLYASDQEVISDEELGVHESVPSPSAIPENLGDDEIRFCEGKSKFIS